MTIFTEMHETREIGSQRDFEELKRMLSEAISRGYVEQIPVMKPNRFLPRQTWYRDRETGQIYSLVPPGDRGGWWAEVDPEDLRGPGEKVQ
jgi:hypothetical protein